MIAAVHVRLREERSSSQKVSTLSSGTRPFITTCKSTACDTPYLGAKMTCQRLTQQLMSHLTSGQSVIM
jgi:hypothetical protein